ncbi:MAG: aminoacetone oxidase family FAD-binding enzyme [Prevotella sp.]|nr:aminoacetone oxidase family FAD-binding enzyme [Prevotella sp.]
MRTAVIGGGAAGFFFAVNLKEMMPEMDVTIFERSQRVLTKVEVSGGGRCNCTNSFAGVTDLQQVYPRGHRLMKRLLNVFDHQDAYEWFENHGVPLVTQDDECVFPKAQDSHAIIDCFLSLARRYSVRIRTGEKIISFSQLEGFDNIVVTTGGSPSGKGLEWLADLGHEIEAPVPSLFSFSVADKQLQALQGLVVNDVTAMLPGTKLRADGPLLITHWGVSGPAILRLSSYAARYLAEREYRSPLSIRWVQLSEEEIRAKITEQQALHAQKQLSSFCPFGLQQRLWAYLLQKSLEQRAAIRWAELNKKDINRLMNVLLNDTYQTAGRAPFKDEFVTCGGISLKAVNLSTLESRHVPHLYFAGEVLDIDGVTGGFNFQAAWTTAYIVASSISRQLI